MDLFEKIKNKEPYIIHHSIGGVRMLAAITPYETWYGEKGIAFHDAYWATNTDTRAIHFVPGELQQLSTDEGVEGHYAIVNKNSNGKVIGFEPITQIPIKSNAYHPMKKDWLNYEFYLKNHPEENFDDAQKRVREIMQDLKKSKMKL